jgi:4-hydroxy-tetrahydrodipicolinate synthase
MMHLSRLFTALITPFTEEGLLDLKSLSSLIRWQEESGVEDLVLLGSTGEAFSLTDEERQQVISTAIQTRQKARIWVGCTAFTGDCVQRYALEAKARGADGIMLAPPPYSKPSQEGIIQTVKQVLHHCSLPILLYTIPSRTGVSMTHETVIELAQNPQIVGIKDASGDLSYSTELLQRLAEAGTACCVYSGDDAATLPLASLGAYGVVSVLSNIAPRTFSTLFSFLEQKKNKEALELHRTLYPLTKALFAAPNPTAVKALAKTLRLCGSCVRLPHTPVSKNLEEALIAKHKTLQQSPYFCDQYPLFSAT